MARVGPLPTRSQITRGGMPRRAESWTKSESLETDRQTASGGIVPDDGVIRIGQTSRGDLLRPREQVSQEDRQAP